GAFRASELVLLVLAALLAVADDPETQA
ncbi:MAG: hypothetical protein H6Q08_1926, partial [Acidobacteria bacterium]|nr:hypothetical protein [Acidobacteriota bacterium]